MTSPGWSSGRLLRATAPRYAAPWTPAKGLVFLKRGLLGRVIDRNGTAAKNVSRGMATLRRPPICRSRCGRTLDGGLVQT